MINKYDMLIWTHSNSNLTTRDHTEKPSKIFSNNQQNSRPPHCHYNDINLSVLKNISFKSLCPKSHRTPSPPPDLSYTIEATQKFNLPPARGPNQSKPTNLIKANKRLTRYTPEHKKERMQKAIFQNRLNLCISREAKRIIQVDKIQKFKEQLNEKLNKAELNKLKKQKKSVTQSYIFIFINLNAGQAMNRLIKKRKEYKNKIQRYLMSISVICKAFGKFKRSLGTAKKTIALRKIKKYLIKYVKRFLENRKKKYSEVIMEIVENFNKYVSVSRINYMVSYQIRLIQKMIKDFLVVNRFRKHALRLLWNKNDLKAKKVPEKVQHFYISSYLTDLFEDYLNKRKKMIRFALFMTMMDSEEGQGIKASEMVEMPFFRVFYVRNVKKMITKAWDEQEKWADINFSEFPIKLEKEKRIENIHPHKGLKRRKTIIKSKRGLVAFKIL